MYVAGVDLGMLGMGLLIAWLLLCTYGGPMR